MQNWRQDVQAIIQHGNHEVTGAIVQDIMIFLLAIVITFTIPIGGWIILAFVGLRYALHR